MAIRIEHQFGFSAANVWAIVGQPDRVDWVPGVTGCEFDGEVRRFSFPGAGKLAERILSLDALAREIHYGVIESNPPLIDHHASINVVSNGEGSVMIWCTEVDPISVEPFIEKSMHASLARIQNILEQNK